MRARAALLAALLAWSPAAAETDPVAAAEAAAAALADAAGSLSAAEGARDRVAALTETIRAYEDGLAALREGLRQAALRERAIRADFDRESEMLTKLLGAMVTMQTSPETLVLLHPAGALSTARAGMILSDVTPAINAEVSALRGRLEELEVLRLLQESALDTLQQGLDGAQEARAALSRAISDRAPPPDGGATDAAAMQALINSAETLQGFASSLVSSGGTEAAGADFAAAEGTLPLPVAGAVIARFGQADAAGVRRPGWLIATAPRALVTNPWPATVRYSGPLLDLGQVVIVEPEAGFLLVFAGLAEAFVRRGEVLDTGAPLGLMGGSAPDAHLILIDSAEGGGQDRSETLYMELRRDDAPLDPAPWFGAAKE